MAEREVEKAKLFWHRGDCNHARTCLNRIISSHYESLAENNAQTPSEHSLVAVAEVYMLYAHYNEQNSKFERAEVMRYYKKAIELCPTWETTYFRLAVYYDKYLASRPSNSLLYWRIYKQAVQNYATCLRYGSKNVYQAMSRTITLWMDVATDVLGKTSEKLNSEAKTILEYQQDAVSKISNEVSE